MMASVKHKTAKEQFNPSSSAFTIVELLVVVIIIAILATLTLVSYTAISRQAIVGSMQSDLANASTALKAFQVERGNYPDTISTNCSASPDTATNKCLKLSGSNTYSNYVASNSAVPKTFSLTVSNPGLTYSYITTSESKPAALQPAPNDPTADWLATLQGDHYGNFYDLVGKSYATVTRAGSKTVYDPQSQHIYDVPANYLAITPRSDGKSGVEAVVEEGRTNYLTNSDGESALGNPAWYNNNWGGSTATVTQDTSSLAHGATSVKFATTNWVDNSFSLIAWNNNLTATVPMINGTTYTYSIFGKVVSGSATYRIQFQDTNGTTNQDITLTDRWQRFSVTRTLGAGVTNIVLRVYAFGANQVSLWDAAQIEAGSFMTSYIPTTASIVSRNHDVVTVPTTSWNANAGSFVGVSGDASNTSTGSLAQWSGVLNPSLRIAGGSYGNTLVSQNGTNYATAAATAAGYRVSAATWDSSSGTLMAYYNGNSSVYNGAPFTPSTGSVCFIGEYGSNLFFYDGAIQRLVVYPSVLSGGNVTTITNTIKDGPQ